MENFYYIHTYMRLGYTHTHTVIDLHTNTTHTYANRPVRMIRFDIYAHTK